jgi:nucleotide-binding universal stress UspA family protein
VRSALVAFEPCENPDLPELDAFCRQVDGLRSLGLFRWVRVVSVLHPEQYPYPSALFQAMRFQLRRRVEEELRGLLEGRLPYQHMSVLLSGGPNTQEMVEIVSRTAKKKRADLLLLLWHGRESLWERLFGGFAQSAISYSSVPVLVVRPGIDPPSVGRQILAAVDVEHLPTGKEIGWLVKAARQMGLPLKLAYVKGRSKGGREVVDASLKLRRLCRCFSERGVKVSWEILPEEISTEYTLNSYAALSGAGLMVVFFREKSWLSRFTEGSTVYRLLALSCRPVLVLRASP